MKLIIIEGCDNLGKSTLIANLVKYYSQNYNVLVKHSGKPTNKNMDPLREQQEYFINETNNLHIYKHTIEAREKKETIVIYDRFVQGEYVWGSIYRKYSLDDIKHKCIEPVMKNLTFNIGQSNIVSILLDASSYFIYYNDDGYSFCSHENMDSAIKLINQQRDIFKNVMTDDEYIPFNNNIIYDVQNTSSIYTYGDFVFKNESIICNDIINLINEKIHLN